MALRVLRPVGQAGDDVTPNSFQVSEAAALLGVDVFYLGHALRDEAASMFRIESDRVRGFERPNFGVARALLRAAEACEKAWDEELQAVTSGD